MSPGACCAELASEPRFWPLSGAFRSESWGLRFSQSRLKIVGLTAPGLRVLCPPKKGALLARNGSAERRRGGLRAGLGAVRLPEPSCISSPGA